jgi:NAD(P)-dependent dehydrogenase (short-subunit alcohol dehydrogenase family)
MSGLDFSDAVVVVTGAAAGIGLGIAQAFHAAGARVALGGTPAGSKCRALVVRIVKPRYFAVAATRCRPACDRVARPTRQGA